MKVPDGKWFDIKESLAPAWSAIIVLVTEAVESITENFSWKLPIMVVNHYQMKCWNMTLQKALWLLFFFFNKSLNH